MCRSERSAGESGLLNTGIKVIHHELSEVQPDYSSLPPWCACVRVRAHVPQGVCRRECAVCARVASVLGVVQHLVCH